MRSWQPSDHGWKVFPIAGHDFGMGGGGRGWWGAGGVELMGHSSGITSTIAKWKPFLEGGNKELSVWAAPFGQGEILSAATAPPILPLGLITTAGQGGQSAAPVPRPTAPLTIVAVGFLHLHEEDEEAQRRAVVLKFWWLVMNHEAFLNSEKKVV